MTTIRIAVDDKTITAQLADNPTAQDLAAQLPLTLSIRDFNRLLSVLIPSLGLVIVAVIGLFGQLAASRNERTVTQQEIELLQKLDPTSTAARDLSEVIEARVQRWHDKVVQKPGKAPTVASTDRLHDIIYWVGGVAGVLAVLLLVISLVAAGVEWLLGIPIR